MPSHEIVVQPLPDASLARIARMLAGLATAEGRVGVHPRECSRMDGSMPHRHIAIVGAGFAGLGMAIKLKQEDVEDFVVLERAEDVGGTWRDNTYPGCGCDVPSHLYSFSFAPNPNWSRTFSRQAEIWEYLRAVSRRYGGKDGSNLWMAVIREHFAAKGLGLHNDLQNEHSIVGNFPIVTMLDRYGRDDQKAMIDGSITGKYRITFGLTEPRHGSDATHMETRAVPASRDNIKGWLIDGEDVDDRHARRHPLCPVCAHFRQ